MQEVEKNIKDMTWEGHLECNRQFIRKLRETPEYRQQEKEYKQKNQERINTKGREKITCSCGCVLTKNSLSRHKKTQHH